MFSEHVFSLSREDEPHIGTLQLSLLSYMNESLFFKALNSFPTPFLFCNTLIGSLEKLYYVSRACFVSLTQDEPHIGTGQLSLLSYMNESLFFKAFNPFPTTFSFRNTLIGSLSLIPVQSFINFPITRTDSKHFNSLFNYTNEYPQDIS